MFRFAIMLIPVALLILGCGQPAAAPVLAVAAAAPASTEPGEIELSDAKVTFVQPNRVRFEVRYRFTKGKPDKYYLCEVSFPGTTNHAARPLDTWEMKPEGILRDTIILSKPPVAKFEIRLSEAVSPQNGYQKISNVVTGNVE